jgi:uncharacterized protein (TIGR03435 family)
MRKQNLREQWLIAALSILALGTTGVPLRAQSSKAETQSIPDWQVVAGKRLEFEVATVKPNPSDEDAKVNFVLGPGDVYAKTGGRFLATNVSLLDYIRFAYKLTDGQTQIMQANAPQWLAAKRFDIEAKSESSNPTKDQMRLMMQSLLAERFKLAVHAETRQLPVLVLVLAKPGKLGQQLKPHSPEDNSCSNIATPAEQKPEVSSAPQTPSVCGGLVSASVPDAPGHIRIVGRNIPIALIAAHLGEMGQFNRPILDRTDLKGTFDFALEWGADPIPGSTGPPDHDAMGTSLQEALLDQLGLKLERQQGPVEVLLIDHIDEQPTAN